MMNALRSEKDLEGHQRLQKFEECQRRMQKTKKKVMEASRSLEVKEDFRSLWKGAKL